MYITSSQTLNVKFRVTNNSFNYFHFMFTVLKGTDTLTKDEQFLIPCIKCHFYILSWFWHTFQIFNGAARFPFMMIIFILFPVSANLTSRICLFKRKERRLMVDINTLWFKSFVHVLMYVDDLSKKLKDL